MGNTIVEFLQSIISLDEVWVLVALILANLVTGSLAAAIQGQFEVKRLGDFVKRLGVIFAAYLGVGIVATQLVDFEPLRTMIWVFQIAFLTDRILGNLRDWGLPVPEGLTPINRIMNRLNLPAKLRRK